MGFIQSEDARKYEIEEFKRLLVACAGLNPRKRDFNGFHQSPLHMDPDDDDGEKLVCVTSGISFLGLAIVNQLLLRGYSVRIVVDNEEDIEKLKELERTGEIRTSRNGICAVMGQMSEVESLIEAFQHCRGVFHTSAFTDPAGLSGYTKSMAEIEVKANENVIKACSRTPSVRKCVLTSSLLACIWRDGSSSALSPVINHDSWSDESLCTHKKLWYALGKLKAEKAAWKMAKESGVKLATVCPALITGSDFVDRSPTPTIAYLKGAQEMFADGLLAIVDVVKVAEAHVCVYEAINKTAFGRYICYEHVIYSEYEAEKLARQIGIPEDKICGNSSEHMPAGFKLSNKKLADLLSRTHRSCFNQS